MRRLMWTAALLLLASSVWAQSLAEVARKEKERRKKVEAADTHTYTETDLRNAEGPMTQVTGSSTATAEGTEGETTGDGESAEGASTESGEPAEEDPTRTEAYWRGRLAPLDERIADIQARLQQPEYTQNQTGMRERQALERQLEQARSARQAVVDEGRRAGVPPGWLR